MTTPGPAHEDPTSPDERLAEATQARVRAGALDQRVEAARERLRSSEAEAERLAARLTEEERDVTRLESPSWSRTLSTLRGSRSSDVEREQAERDAARCAVGVADDRARTDRAELDSLLARRAELGDVGAAHAAALAAKEEWLAARDPALATRLHEIAEERGRLGAEDRESREAFAAGQRAFRHLSDASASLADARSWASWDTFGGGGLLTDAMKYDRLDQMGQDLRQVTAALDRLGARGHEIRARLGTLAEERTRLVG